MAHRITPTLWKVTLLSLAMIFSLFVLMIMFTMVIQVTLGQDKFTFGNEFFIQCVTFTLVIAETVLLTRFIDFTIPDRNALFSLQPAKLVEIIIAVAMAIALTFPLSQMDNLLQVFFPPGEAEKQMMFAAYHPASAVEKVFVVLSLIAAAPVGEELLFRGVMLSWIRDCSKWWVALIITAILFGVSHVFIPRTIILIIPVGLLLGWIVIRTGSVFASIAAHACFNGFPLFAYWSGLKIKGYNAIGDEHAFMSHFLWIAGAAALIFFLYVLEIVVKSKKTDQDE